MRYDGGFQMEDPGKTWPEGNPESQKDFFNEDDWDDPRSYCPRSAPIVLQELGDKFRTLEWIPRYDGGWARVIYKGIEEVGLLHT
jgi:hypothetical protein